MTVAHPLLREIQLGRSIESVCEDFLEEFNFQALVQDQLVNIVREIIRLNDPNMKFVVFVESDNCYISSINSKWDRDLIPNYWDDEYNFALSDDAECDCDMLNDVVNRLFGEPKKKFKKMTKADFLKKKGKCCPYCSCSKNVVLDDFVTFKTERVIGCSKCGNTWNERYEMKLKGYE